MVRDINKELNELLKEKIDLIVEELNDENFVITEVDYVREDNSLLATFAGMEDNYNDFFRVVIAGYKKNDMNIEVELEADDADVQDTEQENKETETTGNFDIPS